MAEALRSRRPPIRLVSLSAKVQLSPTAPLRGEDLKVLELMIAKTQQATWWGIHAECGAASDLRAPGSSKIESRPGTLKLYLIVELVRLIPVSEITLGTQFAGS